jgi:RNA polymerase-binding transcription factor DksA
MPTRMTSQNKPGGFRNVLLAERARLLAGASHNLEALTIPDGAAIEDHPPQIHDQLIALRAHQIDRRKLELIDALRRLESGGFGLCQECGRPFPLNAWTLSLGSLLRAVSGTAGSHGSAHARSDCLNAPIPYRESGDPAPLPEWPSPPLR